MPAVRSRWSLMAATAESSSPIHVLWPPHCATCSQTSPSHASSARPAKKRPSQSPGTTQSSDYSDNAARSDPDPAALHTLGFNPSRLARCLPCRPLSADAVDMGRLDHLRRRHRRLDRDRTTAAIALPLVDPRQLLTRGRDVAPTASIAPRVRTTCLAGPGASDPVNSTRAVSVESTARGWV